MNAALARCEPCSRMKLVADSAIAATRLHILADDSTSCRPDRAALIDADSALTGLHSLLIALPLEMPT